MAVRQNSAMLLPRMDVECGPHKGPPTAAAAQGRLLGTTKALLLAGGLRSGLTRPLDLEHRAGKEIRRVAVDGKPVDAPLGGPPSASDLLSNELDQFGRDPIYEAAVEAA